MGSPSRVITHCRYTVWTLASYRRNSSSSSKFQSTRELLLMDALRKALKATRAVASVAVVVEAKDENPVKFYKRYGFIEIADHPERLFIPMATVRQLFATES